MISIDSQPVQSSVATPIVSTSTSKNMYGSLYALPFSPWSMHHCVDRSEQATLYHAVCWLRPTASPPCSNISRFGMFRRSPIPTYREKDQSLSSSRSISAMLKTASSGLGTPQTATSFTKASRSLRTSALRWSGVLYCGLEIRYL